MSDANLDRAGRLDTATLSDAMDKLGIGGQCLGIKPLDPGFRLLGRAVTFQYAAAAKPAGSVGDYIDDVPPGSVVVLDNGGREDATVWGDILTSVAHRRGIAGTLIDGACRDTDLARSLGYPLFSRSYSMRTGKDRVQLEASGTVVTIGDARVAPGDIVRGDADGAVILPRAHEDAILDIAEEIERAEASIRAALDLGMRLDEARKQLNYHLLQRREAN
ncbi:MULTISPECIES: RraA family protein [unclassified Sphingomonas]|uniref:RraA family protein n=1 Tax=unclassified Sphingomonas TaxID=196159 RepID=UPI0006FC311E|nr:MULTISPECIES: RraA family protein [unclassified Sphingomonas]KQX25135.1 diguanylate cyclase [Sphingomonas sp. Root1294]KQY66152.1 diguanylate cyclase [Sphingomonas sp. Root50]KRB89682.1 diguanylate cyclase [Sphingomonas sp. Root720]